MNNDNLSKSSPWPKAIISFFLLLFCVEATILTVALTTSRGLIEDNAYEKGLEYQTTIDGLTRASSWEHKLAFQAVKGNERAMVVNINNSDGRSLSDAVIEFEAIRPSSKKLDTQGVLIEDPSLPGTYRTNTRILEPGLWFINLKASKEGQDFHFKDRILIK